MLLLQLFLSLIVRSVKRMAS